MRNLETVVKRVKSDIAKGYVFTMMKPEELKTLIDEINELMDKNNETCDLAESYQARAITAEKAHDHLQDRVEALQRELEKADKEINRCANCGKPITENTPTYIRYLLDELEKSKIALYTHESYDETVCEMNDEMDYLRENLRLANLNIEELASEHTAMKKALEWYGDMEHYTVLPGAQLTGTEKDMGYKARKALSDLTKEEPTNGTVEQ